MGCIVEIYTLQVGGLQYTYTLIYIYIYQFKYISMSSIYDLCLTQHIRLYLTRRGKSVPYHTQLCHLDVDHHTLLASRSMLPLLLLFLGFITSHYIIPLVVYLYMIELSFSFILPWLSMSWELTCLGTLFSFSARWVRSVSRIIGSLRMRKIYTTHAPLYADDTMLFVLCESRLAHFARQICRRQWNSIHFNTLFFQFHIYVDILRSFVNTHYLSYTFLRISFKNSY